MNESNFNRSERLESRDELAPPGRGWFMALGIVLIILGALAVSAAFITTLLSVSFIGWLLLIGGAVLVIQSFTVRRWSGFFLEIFTGLLYMLIGLMLVSHPLASAASFTLLLAAFFIVGGIFRIIGSLVHRPAHWGWVLLNGLVAVLLGVMIWAQWPVSALWVIGTFVGIDMIIAGWSFVMMSAALRRPLPPAHAA
jgi:uncharacterized membrane protein HdeD (DUF308 family)